MDSLLNFKEPWYKTDQDLTNTLKKEISKNHVLYGVELKSIGRRQDNDDALFQIINKKDKFVIVHLTWAGKTIKDQKYPLTWFYNSSTEVQEKINEDNIDWE